MTGKQTILLVDDDELNRDMLGRRLIRAGFDVIFAESGEAALDAVASNPIDLVLLDVMMPGMSGLEVLDRMRSQRSTSRLPIILVTAKAQSEDVVQGLEAGADDYLTKPVVMPVALARIKTQLARRRAEAALTESEERYALAVKGANDGVWDWRPSVDAAFYSNRWVEIMGYDSMPTPTIESWYERVHPDDVDKVRGDMEAHLAGETAHLEVEHRIRRGDMYRWVLVRGLAVRDEQGAAVRVAGSMTDITEGKVADALTGLPNRLLFHDRLDRLFRNAARVPGFQFAVLFLDLDRFKTVNDGLGHAAGDDLLVQTARLLEKNLRTTDSVMRLDSAEPRPTQPGAHTVARFGGDEFAVILAGIHHPQDATRVASRLNTALAEPFMIGKQEVFISASIGIALSATGYCRAEEMLRDADTALYRAKAAGRGRYELFDERMREEVVRRLELENDLRRALERKEFVLYYQPIVNLESGTVTGQEALIRWQHPTRGLVPPGDFLPIAEDTGLIGGIGFWVVEEVTRQLAEWLEKHQSDDIPVVSINLSVKQLTMPDFVERICGIIDSAAVPRQLFEFEITESLMMADPVTSELVLRRLKTAGFRLSVDDFGTGYSSLSYLQRFPVDRLKLDRSFLPQIDSDGEATGIVQSVILLAEHLKLEVVAEGIETVSQLDAVKSLHCQLGQGFFFRRPGPPGTNPVPLLNQD
jgi:PAS domain S-box-containing protein